MLVMVVFFIAFRWIHLSTPLLRLFLLVLILLLMPTLNSVPVWFALSLLRFRLPSRLPMMVILFFFQAEDGIRAYKVTGVQTCALPISSNVYFCFCGLHVLSGTSAWPMDLKSPPSSMGRDTTFARSARRDTCVLPR